MIRDRDSVYGAVVRARVKVMGIEEVVTARRSPRWSFQERQVALDALQGSARDSPPASGESG